MGPEDHSAWIQEILSYLLGRPSSKEGSYGLPMALQPVPKALTWWMFKGKRYRGVEGALEDAWEWMAFEVAQLRMHFNPRMRIVDHPYEPVDWIQTYLRSGGTTPREYVAHSSGIGLTEPEWKLVCGWAAWICKAWEAFASKRESQPEGYQSFHKETADLRAQVRGECDRNQAHQWLHLAMRSRWPFLRNIVAETLRCFEPEETMDSLPLPMERPALFELLVCVRLLQVFQPDPPQLHWISLGEGHALEFPEGQFQIQFNWSKEQSILAAYQDPGLPNAIKEFNLRTHCRPDLRCLFQPKRAGFLGILIECKSGDQKPSDALHQLRSYRAIQQKENPGRLVLWGIVENSEFCPMSHARAEWLKSQQSGPAHEDVWLFTGPDRSDLKQSLVALGLIPSVGE